MPLGNLQAARPMLRGACVVSGQDQRRALKVPEPSGLLVTPMRS